MKLYNLPEYKNTKIYCKDNNNKPIVVIFDHIDGMYSYCWLEEDRSQLIHIANYMELRKYKDGYKLKQVKK